MAAVATQTLPGITVAEDDVVARRNLAWKKFSRHRPALLGAIVLLVFVFCAIFAPLLSHFDPNAIDPEWQGTPLAPGVDGHILGTDELGRDLLTRLMFGARISLSLAVTAMFIEVLVGTVLGACAGYFGGWVDYVIMRVTDVFLSIPLLPLLLVLTGIVAATSVKSSLGPVYVALIIGILSWMTVARLVRAAFLSLREKEFAEAARAIGSRNVSIMFKHLLPNAAAPIIVQATLDVAGIIILESALSYLGFGVQPPTASWGNMLSNAQENMQIAWWAGVFPGICIFLTVLAINYMGDGLRDALDPNVE
ncbi:MAG: ABC transporter permease [Candidatus Eremiobacteraeota bacterium]|nr:ABC transporter permease [Candidatus Eremiobacteraeota bacterium]MBV8223548.1 ABC transporter permease [Candidatus Eremiobacteraeota bacterium]